MLVLFSDVKIHDLHHEMEEWIGLLGVGEVFRTPSNGIFNAEQLLYWDDEHWDDIVNGIYKYKGNVFTDAVIAMGELSDDFGALASEMTLKDHMNSWAFGKKANGVNMVKSDDDYTALKFTFNTDGMIHAGKGINAIRIDGVDAVIMSSVDIYDIRDSTALGDEKCQDGGVGAGFSSHSTYGHFRQSEPHQHGFGGNSVQGISLSAATDVSMSDISIYNVQSDTGQAFGVSVWPTCSVSIDGDISISQMSAGTLVESDTYGFYDVPNRAPEVCGFRYYDSYEDIEFGTIYTSDLRMSEDVAITIDDDTMSGHVACFGYDMSTTAFNTVDYDFGDLELGYLYIDTSAATNANSDSSEVEYANLASVKSHDLTSNNSVIYCAVFILAFAVMFGVYLCLQRSAALSKTEYSALSQATNDASYGTV